MKNAELADEIERHFESMIITGDGLPNRDEWQQIIAALRQSSGQVRVLRDLVKVLEDVHDAHKRHSLPLTDSQFTKLNRARSILSAAAAEGHHE